MSKQIETMILGALCFNEGFSNQFLPHIDQSHFAEQSSKHLFKIIYHFIDSYDVRPTLEALILELGKYEVDGDTFEECKKQIGEFKNVKKLSEDYIKDEAATYIQNRALYNAMMEGLEIAEKGDPQQYSAIPEILTEAITMDFSNECGMDFYEDAEERFQIYHEPKQKIPFHLEVLNKATKGGVEPKTINIILGGCVHPSTKIRVRYRSVKEYFEEKDIPISDIEKFLERGYEVEVDSPDGYVPVTEFVDKGHYDGYKLIMEDGTEVLCNYNHLFETTNGWEYAQDIAKRKEGALFFTREGIKTGHVHKLSVKIPIVDIQVDHPNHRYYTENVSSHNTNVGKTAILCDLTANYMLQGYNVLYITLEMAEHKIYQRVDANIFDVTMDELMMMKKESFMSKVNELKKKSAGNLKVREYPTSAATSRHVSSLMKDLRLRHDFKPDIICVDYLNIMQSSRYSASSNNSYTIVKAIAEELRGIAVQNKAAVWTATQMNRDGIGNTDADLTNTSDSIGSTFTADYVVAAMTSEQLKASGKLYFKQLKSRYDDIGKMPGFTVGADFEKMKLHDIQQTQDAKKEIKNEPIDQDDLYGRFKGSRKRASEELKV